MPVMTCEFFVNVKRFSVDRVQKNIVAHKACVVVIHVTMKCVIICGDANAPLINPRRSACRYVTARAFIVLLPKLCVAEVARTLE